MNREDHIKQIIEFLKYSQTHPNDIPCRNMTCSECGFSNDDHLPYNCIMPSSNMLLTNFTSGDNRYRKRILEDVIGPWIKTHFTEEELESILEYLL